MSRRPGIGKKWYELYKNEAYSKDFVTESGKVFKVPRYYDKLYDIDSHSDYERIRKERKKRAKEQDSDMRLTQREKAVKSMHNKRKRSYEHEN